MDKMEEIDPKEMYTDFNEMIDKLRYYAEMCKSGSDSSDSSEGDTSNVDDTSGDGEDPKVSAFALAIKRKMDNAK